MRADLLEILRCPKCGAGFALSAQEENSSEVRSGTITCEAGEPHEFEIRDGIVYLGTGFDHETVQPEQDYSSKTFSGDPRMTDPAHVSQYPDTLALIWPHMKHIGPDFRSLMKHLDLGPGRWVLDIGTASCWSSRLLAEANAHVVAFDVVDTEFNGLRTADVQFDAHGVFFERVFESMTTLPIADASVDHVVFTASFHHTPDAVATLRECYRVLKPGGSAALLHEVMPLLEYFRVLAMGSNHSQSKEQGSSHKDIHPLMFNRWVQQTDFRVEFVLTDRIRNKIGGLLPGALERGARHVLERFPALLQHLNTSLIMLHKPN